VSILTAGTGFSQQGLGRKLADGHSVPLKPYPMTVVYSALIDSAPDGVYQTFFAFGPTTFSGTDYYTTAIVASFTPVRMSLGANGSDTTTGIAAVTGKWMRHGFRAFMNAAGDEKQHHFFYDLPRLDFISHPAVGLPTYFDTPPADAYVRIADVWWANQETLAGRMSGFKMWQAVLSPQEMYQESLSPFPVLDKYRDRLWCCIPLRFEGDRFDVSGNGRHFYVGSGGSAPVQTADPPSFVRRLFLGATADFPPSFSVQPSDQSGVVGGTATFSTTVNNATSYQWQKSADGTNWSNVSGGTGGTSDDYTTPTIARSDGGAWYRLQATNAFGTTTSNRVMLTVTDIPASYSASVGFVVGSGV